MFESPIIFLQKFSSKFMDVLMNFFSFIGEPYVIIAIMAYVYWNLSKKQGLTMSIIFLVSMYINQILKLLVHTPRPYEAVPQIEGKRIETAGGHAFPSGHSQGASTFYMLLSKFYMLKWLWITSVILVLGVGISRMYLGVHWPIDVLGGWLIGLLFAYLGYEVLYPLIEDDNKAPKALLGIVALLLLSVLVSVIFVSAADALPLFLMLSTTLGTVIGYLLDLRFSKFVEGGKKVGVIILRYLIGMVVVIAIIKGLEGFISNDIADISFRYFLIGLWISFGFPALGKMLKLFN